MDFSVPCAPLKHNFASKLLMFCICSSLTISDVLFTVRHLRESDVVSYTIGLFTYGADTLVNELRSLEMEAKEH